MKDKRKKNIEDSLEEDHKYYPSKKEKVNGSSKNVQFAEEEKEELEFEDPYEDEYEEEEKIDDDWEDESNEEEEEEVKEGEENNDTEMIDITSTQEAKDQRAKEKNRKKKDKKKQKEKEKKKQALQEKSKVQIWDGNLEKNEELMFDNSAYEMLHRSKVEWPCLSVDFLLRDRVGTNHWHSDIYPKLTEFNSKLVHDEESKIELRRYNDDNYPYSMYVIAGSQASQAESNKVYIMKWTDMYKTKNDDKDDDNDDEENDENNMDDDAVLFFEDFQHKGAVNRIRSMHGSNIVATWSENAEISIFDVSTFVERVDAKHASKPLGKKPKKNEHRLKVWQHSQEGYALDWSPLSLGRFATGDTNSAIYLYSPSDSSCSDWIMDEAPYLGHAGSVEDIQFSPVQAEIFASCSVDKTIKLWDIRSKSYQVEIKAHESDVNVISWNHHCSYLLASGSDDASFKIWDLRFVKKDAITHIRWHNGPITSVQFQPREDSVLAVSSSDNKVTLWDFSVEADEMRMDDEEEEIPQQLMFLHQGQDEIKELKFHPYYDCMLLTTAADSFNIFRPNLKEESVASMDDTDNIKAKMPEIKQAFGINN